MFNFGEHLRKLRLSKGLTQKQLAEKVGVSERGIQNYEMGVRLPAYEILTALSDYFEVPVGFLVGKKGTDLTRANLSRANLSHAVACGAIFVEADLSDADLRNADLRWADFSRANLKGAKLEGAKIEGTVFDGANLSGTILEGKR